MPLKKKAQKERPLLSLTNCFSTDKSFEALAIAANIVQGFDTHSITNRPCAAKCVKFRD